MRGHQKHTIMKYRRDRESWTEFECGVCHVDMDFEEENEALDAAISGATYSCLNCGAEETVRHVHAG